MSNSNRVPISQFSKEMQSILAQFENSVKTDLDDAMNETADEGVKKLKATSPKRKRRKKGAEYRKSWEKVKEDGHYFLRNKEYRLPHLLEKGHDIVIKGTKRGYSPAQPHIKPVEEWCQKHLPERFRKKVER